MTSASAEAVSNLENIARDIYDRPDRASTLARDAHVEYLLGGLRTLPTALTALDASRAWIVYWCVHGLALLGVDLRERDEALASDVVRFLRRCRSRRGERACFGFGGGPGQMPHVASRVGRRTAVTRFAGSRRALWRATSGRWISRVSSAGW
jgi:protein farnesyltransferase subunit beta